MKLTTVEGQQQAQRAYYAKTAQAYDQAHFGKTDSHQFALAWLRSTIELLGITSVLDIGSGTGRALLTLKEAVPGLRAVGIEPSQELREIGFAKGLSQSELIDGNAHSLDFADGSFDIVCEFGALHHIPEPHRAVDEMLRVAHTGVFISDCNNFGQGSIAARLAKRAIRFAGLWRTFDKIRTRGKGYHISEGDGLYYSYSVFDNYPQIAAVCPSIHLMNTVPAGLNPFFSAPQVALLGLKESPICSA